MMSYTLPVVFLLSVVFHTPTLSENLSLKPPEHDLFSGSLYATCRMRPNTQLASGMPRVYGHVLFKQTGPDEELQVKFKLHGLPASNSQSRAIHIHQYGDLSEGCTSTGGHYNPEGANHPLHPGDFGNFIAHNGKIRQSVDSKATLYGGLSVLGRAVVIHEKEDDMGQGGDAGSLLHGNAGGRLACCVIGISSSKVWNKSHL
ncbi:extracellular superoxide dismutase [Cu-Zn] [Pangasianodon hypophthalmus]|uniref:extracellular superoxide dismutase [Cu-Zn] n=1 Tax=Pangasianodon hypophthalmus TaxID=310915 RepID=UPI002307EAAA|nr:extracellular superoxide dismutase [Cu-Zn] [Pangasianodon hypophthalmus]